MNLEIMILIVSASACINVLLACIVLSRNPNRMANIAFTLTCLTITSWATLNFLTQQMPDHALALTRATGISGSATLFSMFMLAASFPRKMRLPKRLWVFVVASGIVVVAGCLTNALADRVTVTPEGMDISTGWFYPVYLLYLVLLLALIVYGFRLQYRGATRIAKSQLNLLYAGISTTVFLVLSSNVFLPAITKSWSTAEYGTPLTIPFVALSALAIIKGHMFDIRAVFVRIIAYILALSIVAILYALAVTMVIVRIVSFDEISQAQLAALIVPTIISSLTFPYIKRFVDKLTMRLFYHDSYQVRDVLNRLTDVLIAASGTQQILRRSMEVLGSAIHPSSVYVAVVDKKGNIVDDDGVLPLNFHIITKDSHLKKHIIISRDEHENTKIAHEMDIAGAGLILVLKHKTSIVGYVFFGMKKSGGSYTSKDIQLLTISAKNLAIALENAIQYEEIAHFADTLQEEVVHATTRLRHANEKLKTLDKLKDDFISMASHQFRTPAASIRQALKMINSGEVTPSEKKDILKLAEASSEQLVTIVGTMLSISRLQAGRFIFSKSSANLVALVQKVIGMTNVLADQKSIKLEFIAPGKDIVVQADVAKINESMSNYVENAIKYSSQGSTVRVTLRCDDKKAYFEVLDQGMGVPEEERAHLFNKFYRANNARQHQPDGNGIGLYVVKSIAEGHEGGVYYEPQDNGSLFGFWLPLK